MMRALIDANDPGKRLLSSLCDFALKGGGLVAFNTVSAVLRCIEPTIPQKPQPEKEKVEDNKE